MPTLEADQAREYLQKQNLSDSLGEAVTKSRYKIREAEKNMMNEPDVRFEAENPRNGYRAAFKVDGTTLLTGGEKNNRWKTSLKLTKFGRSKNLRAVSPGKWEARENRAENRRDSVTEWYENKSTGLEHGFTIGSKPETSSTGTQDLRLAMKIDGNLRASLDENGQILTLGNQDLRYSKLKVWDAVGSRLSSRMELRGDELSIVVDDSAATYPVTIDPVFESVKRVTASDGASNDGFGNAVSISGDVAIVGAIFDDNSKGAAYIFERMGDTEIGWNEVKKITASDGVPSDQFGHSVSINWDTAIVGAPRNENLKGAAYIFERNQGGENNWGEAGKLVASDGKGSDHFGKSVSINWNTVIVGAFEADGFKGSAYVFDRNTGGENNWGEVKKLTASDGGAGEQFGLSVSVSNNTAIISANGDDSFKGSAYIFERDAGGENNWGEIKKMTASDGAEGDNFGGFVSIDEDLAIIGSPRDDNHKGAAYVFARNTGGMNQWGEVKKLTAPDGEERDNFGLSVSISSNKAIVGAYGDNTNQGAAYIFESNTGGENNWGVVKKLIAPEGATNDLFGFSVSISLETTLIGSYGDDGYKGSAYFFTKLLQTPDLSVTKTSAPNPVTAGSNLSYTITVTNNGPVYITNPSFTDILPEGTSFVQLVRPAGWNCTLGGTVTCSGESLVPGSAVFTLTVNVSSNVADGTVLSNTVTVNSVTTFDPNPENNSATATTTVLNAVRMSPIADQTAFVGQGIFAQASATSNTGPVSYSLTNTDSLMGYIDPLTGAMSFMKPVQEGRVHTITVRATSGAHFAEQSFHLKWIFNWLGFQPPINQNGTSVFYRTAGTVVPVKFKLGFNATQAKAKLFVAPANNPGAEAPAKASDGRTQFVYSATTKEYQFNWKPFGLAPGNYRLRVDLGDGETHSIFVALR